MKYKKNNRLFRHLILAPFIYVLIIPLLVLDVFTEMYHQIGFRLCGIPLIKRSAYLRIDRHKLKYLSWFDKINCVYCGYANGWINYASKIAAETEKYWCGIKHKKSKDFIEPKHHKRFLEYGDEKGYKLKYEK